MAVGFNEDPFLEIIKQQVPQNAVQYCLDLWHEDPFHFILAKSRSSKLGDFRYRMDRNIQQITINNDLNTYQFLITYIHEIAHYRAFKAYGLKIKPHGIEWKKTFQNLMSPMLSDLIFPKDVLLPLKRYMLNPKASTGADLFLVREVRKYDHQGTDKKVTYLSEIKPGSDFLLKGRQFKKEATRRTRILCLELDTGKKYLISGNAEVVLE
ncbi:MAG: SprT-like domain-containing protein [Anditalea sp.]